MLFVDDDGKPSIYIHRCSKLRLGQPMTQQEMFDFALELLIGYFQKKGMEIRDKNRIEGCEFPNIVIKNRSRTTYYILMRVSVYPVNPLDIKKEGYEDVIALAKEFGAIPAFAGISLACASTLHGEVKDMSKPICGAEFFVAFRGLQQL